jgi:hypothetical protein
MTCRLQGEILGNNNMASQVPVGLFAHQVGVLVGVNIKLLIKSDSPAVHGVDVLRGF